MIVHDTHFPALPASLPAASFIHSLSNSFISTFAPR
jgi:hypothetical protein